MSLKCSNRQIHASFSLHQNGFEFSFCKATWGASGSPQEAQGIWSPLVMTALGVIVQKGLLYGNLLILPVLPPGWLQSRFRL